VPDSPVPASCAAVLPEAIRTDPCNKVAQRCSRSAWPGRGGAMASTNEDVVVLATAPSPDGEQLLICAICRIGEPLRSAGGLKRAERCPAHTLTDGEMNFLGLG
jgi:hypothetical protein